MDNGKKANISKKEKEMAGFVFSLAKFIPYRDREVCERVRIIKREDNTKHPNPQFKIRVIENADEFYF